MKYIKYILVLVLAVFIVSCEDFLDPKISEERTYDQLLTQPQQVKGLVTFAYRSIPNRYDNFDGDFLDCATDNAVSNYISGNLSRTAEISSFWSANRGPFWNWSSRYQEIASINQYFDIIANNDIVFLKSSEANDSIFKMNTTGEAYFLRAWCYFDLLRMYGGKDSNGEMKGVPIVTEMIDPEDFLDLPRADYDEVVDQILRDIDSAIVYLPMEWSAFSPNEYQNLSNTGRPTDPAALMLKSRVLLYAASPAFTDGLSASEKEQRWLDAANAAKAMIDLMDFTLPSLNMDDLTTFFNNPQSPEIIQRTVTGNAETNMIETEHFIPTLYGGGRCNPTQNLVDAFPMANGYPIDDELSEYKEDSMYLGRDPRFYMTVLYNGASFGSTSVETWSEGKDVAGGSKQANVTNSTRTGYYLRKWLSEDVVLASGQQVNDFHYNAMFRKVEMHLNFAEAANEAVGPQGDIDGLTAEDALAEVRRRAGIASTGSDAYLAAQAGSKDDFRALVKNERRIELCFEGHRFFDLRRWKEELGIPVYKIEIEREGNDSIYTETFKKVKLLDLAYDNDKFYIPIPQAEITKSSSLTQNENW